MSKFSPGAWTYRDRPELWCFQILDAEGYHFLNVGYSENNKLGREKQALLISSTPQMLALIKKAINIMDDIAQDCGWLDEANALIAEVEAE